MERSMMMDPELTQAVRIVLKYEIQSLLSRLSETGEEYLVLTASKDEGTCGHIGSMKGEGFLQTSSLQTVKQEFLNFCTGKYNVPLERSCSMAAVASTAKPNRRKSTPRCKLQNIPTAKRNMEDVYAGGSAAHMENSISYQAMMNMTDSALDLTDKNGSYSYTLDSKDESKIGSSILKGSLYDEKLESYDSKSCLSISDVQPYTWQEEKIPISTDDISSSSLTDSTNFTSGVKKSERFIDEILRSKGLGLEKISFMREGYSINETCLSNGKQEASGRSRRKGRKAPVKIQRKGSPEEFGKESLFSANVSILNDQDSQTKDEGLNTKDTFTNDESFHGEDKSDVTMNEEMYDNILSNHVKLAVAANLKKSARKHNLQNITDMKSAFEEIGNMAKCLICNKVLANKNNRTFHWRSHVGDKRYRCDICNKAFTHPSNMRSHRKIHTDEKPFPCDLCDRRFRRRDYLLQHLERFHYNPKHSADKALNESESNSN